MGKVYIDKDEAKRLAELLSKVPTSRTPFVISFLIGTLNFAKDYGYFFIDGIIEYLEKEMKKHE
ncbi:MAG: hypothetical protein QXP52_00235 [Candidatus Aenigmatarchaeota archaeon]